MGRGWDISPQPTAWNILVFTILSIPESDRLLPSTTSSGTRDRERALRWASCIRMEEKARCGSEEACWSHLRQRAGQVTVPQRVGLQEAMPRVLPALESDGSKQRPQEASITITWAVFILK